MSVGLNLNFFSSGSLGGVLGIGTLALEGASGLAVADVATRAFGGALSQLGYSGNHSPVLNAFTSGFMGGARLSADAGEYSHLAQQIQDAAYQNGLASATQTLSDQMANLIDCLGGQGQQDQACGGGGGAGHAGQNWMEAIAKAMGDALGRLSQKVVDEAQALDSLAGNSGSSGAQQFQAEMAKFQADSQTLGMLSNAFANAIKTLGEGLQTMASKQ